MTIGFGDLRRGVTIEVDGEPYEVVDYERHKMQQRAPVTRIRMRNLRDGKVVERTFQSYTTEFSLADVEAKPAQYLFNDGQFYTFMDMESYDQYQLTTEQLEDVVQYLKEGTVLDVIFYKQNVINVRLPIFVELEVVDTPPAFRGDTAQGGTKPATLETNLIVQVPLFISKGQKVRIDTRTGQYIERAG